MAKIIRFTRAFRALLDGDRWQQQQKRIGDKMYFILLHMRSLSVSTEFSGIQDRNVCERLTIELVFFKRTVFFLLANYMFPINFLNYKADSMKWFGMRCNSQIDRIESGSVILSALRLNFLAASLSLSFDSE